MASSQPLERPSTPSLPNKPVSLTLENYLSLKVEFRKECRLLQGKCDDMVHDIRKRVQKNCIVYGCCSDGFRFDFLRIDNDSRVIFPFNILFFFVSALSFDLDLKNCFIFYIASTDLIQYTQWDCQEWGSTDGLSESEIYTHIFDISSAVPQNHCQGLRRRRLVGWWTTQPRVGPTMCHTNCASVALKMTNAFDKRTDGVFQSRRRWPSWSSAAAP